ncbi:MAG TPA: exodeoxyribonuclease V subunit gamma [bacterium]|nr:exodeoxyribonuclease V subunit gamma [bacterium]
MSGHSIIASPSWAALEAALFTAIRTEKGADPLQPAVVMVGSHLVGRYLTRKLARQFDGLMNVRFITMRQMAEALGQSGLDREGSRRRLPAIAEDALLEHVLESQKFSYLGALAEFAGFRSALMSTLRDLRDAGLVGELDRLEKKPAGLSPKMRDLASAASSFFGSYRGKFHDGAELFESAAANADIFPARFRTGRLFIYGLYDLTAVQARMIAAIARVAALSVMVPHGKARAYEYARQGLDWFAAALGVRPEPLESVPEGRGGLARVKGALAGARAAESRPEEETGTDGGSVEIIAAPGQAREVEEIAGTMLKYAEQGMAFCEMAVLLRDEAAYLPLIGEVLGRSRIPYYLASGPLKNSVLENCVSRLLALIPVPGAREFFRPEVMAFLSCGALRFPGDDEWAADRWRDYSIEAGIVLGREEWDGRLKKLAGSAKKEEERARIGELRDFMARLTERLSGFPLAGGFGETAGYFAALLRELLRDDAQEQIKDELDAFPDEAAALDGLGVKCTMERFRLVVERWVPSLDPASGGSRERFQEGAATVGNIMALRGARFAAVFVPGLMGRSFPGPVREDPILLDGERGELEEMLHQPGALPRKGRRPAEDRLLFALLTQAAEQRLVLTYARTDEQGLKERLPSPLLLEAASAAQGRPVNYSRMAGKEGGVRRVPLSWTRSASRDPRVLEGRPALDAEEHLLRESARAGMVLPAGAGEIHPFIERGLKSAAQRKKPFSGPCLGRLSGQKAISGLKRFAQENVFSAGQLEDYAKCPFRYFCGRIMRVEAPEKPEDEGFDAAARGGLVHDILRRFMEKAEDQKFWPLRPRERAELLALMEKVFQEACGEWERGNAAAGSRQWQLDRESLARELPAMLESLVEAEREGFKPVEFELAFGLGVKRSRGKRYNHPEPVALALPRGDSILLCGVIDRLDECAGGHRAVRALDYKTGKFPFKKDDELRSGTALQGGLYLIAAQDITGIEVDAFCDSGYVHVLGDSACKQRLCQGGGEYLDRVRGAVKTIVEGMRAGIFCPLPAEASSGICKDYCEYAELCGAGRASLADRLDEGDPAKKVRGKLDEFK